MKRPESVWVRNNGEQAFQDRYDGEDFSIAPGECLELDMNAARLCLGFGEPDKTLVLRRQGWALRPEGRAQGEARLAQFSFHLSEGEARKKTGHLSAPVGESEAPGAGVLSQAPEPASAPRVPVNILDKLASTRAG